jgi:hypothetical protein
MVAGSHLAASATFRNSGPSTWVPGVVMLHWLPGSTFFSWANTALTQAVPPGATATFSFEFLVPAALGPTAFRAALFDSTSGQSGFFGSTLDVPTTIVGGPPNLAATLASQTFPSVIGPGGSASVTVVMLNSGTSAWDPSSILLYNRNAPANAWGIVDVRLGAAVAPQGTASFTFTIRAPSTAPFPPAHFWQLYQEGVGFFGDLIAVPVSVSGTPNLAAELLSEDFPRTMAPGTRAVVQVRLANRGSDPFRPGQTLLYSANAPLNIWGLVDQSVPALVPPGATATIALAIEAPLGPPFPTDHLWQLRDTVAGAFGPLIDVPVTIAASPPDAGVVGDAGAPDATPVCTSSGACPLGQLDTPYGCRIVTWDEQPYTTCPAAGAFTAAACQSLNDQVFADDYTCQPSRNGSEWACSTQRYPNYDCEGYACFLSDQTCASQLPIGLSPTVAPTCYRPCTTSQDCGQDEECLLSQVAGVQTAQALLGFCGPATCHCGDRGTLCDNANNCLTTVGCNPLAPGYISYCCPGDFSVVCPGNSCSSAADCHGTMSFCVAGQCSSIPCQTAADCGPGQLCGVVNRPPLGPGFNFPAGLCMVPGPAPLGARCIDSGECASGYCYAEECVAPCASDADCGGNHCAPPLLGPGPNFCTPGPGGPTSCCLAAPCP